MQKFLKKLTGKILEVFPETRAVILWGSMVKRMRLNKYSDVDIFIVLKDGTRIGRAGLLKIKGSFREDVEPFAINESGLSQKRMMVLGPRGEYMMHGFDRYQLKYESRVIYGDKKNLGRISPISIEKVLRETIPHIQKKFIPRLRQEINSIDPAKFIVANLGYILVITRTIYTMRTKKITTKENALLYFSKQHPNLKDFCYFLLSKYKKTKTSIKLRPQGIIKFMDIASNDFSQFMGHNK